MKRFILLLAAVSLAASGATAQPAQLAKGSILLGVSSTACLDGSWGSELMSLGIMKTTYNAGSNISHESNYRALTLLPKGGYFFMDNLVAGLQAMVSRFSSQNVGTNGKWSETTIGIGPFARYYYPLEKIYPFAEIEAVIGSCKEKWPNSGSGYDITSYSLFSAGLSLGAALPLGDNVSVDMSIGYLRTVWKETEDNEDDYREIYTGPVLRVGFTVFL